MMLKRWNRILAGILAVQIVLCAVVFWPRSAATGGSEPVFPDRDTSQVSALSIADADGNSLVLRQVVGEWVLPGADDYPADASKITPFLEKVLGLDTGRLVTKTDASHKRLQVSPNDFVRRLDLEMGDGEEYVVFLGSSPSYGATHFRLDGQNETYLTGKITSWEAAARASSWIDTQYLSISQDDLVSMRLENASGEFTFTQSEEGTWSMAELAAGDTLAEDKVTSLIRRATSVMTSAPLGRTELTEYGMDAPSALVTMETADGVVTLRVGAKGADESSYVVISSGSPYYVEVSEYSVRDLVEKGYDDFLMVEPTPTPAS